MLAGQTLIESTFGPNSPSLKGLAIAIHNSKVRMIRFLTRDVAHGVEHGKDFRSWHQKKLRRVFTVGSQFPMVAGFTPATFSFFNRRT
jgi:hypothetical protein